MIALLATAAYAGELSVVAVGGVPPTAQPWLGSAGLQVGGSLPLASFLEAELLVHGGWSSGAAPIGSLRAGLRLAQDRRVGLSFAANAGVGRAEAGGLVTVGQLGAAWDFASVTSVRWRAGAGVQAAGASKPMGLLSFGAVFGARPALDPVVPVVVEVVPDPPPVVVETPPPRPPNTVTTNPPTAMVYIPHPICEWVPASEAEALLALTQGDGVAIEVSNPGFLPAYVTVSGPTSVELVAAPPQGSLVVGAWPGDDVFVADVQLSNPSQGVAVANLGEGPVVGRVVGGGRVVPFEAGIASGYATWIAVPKAEPAPLTVPFRVDSSVIATADVARLATYTQNLGGWRVVVFGTASPEGDPVANTALAAARAKVVVERLVAAGVPADRIKTLAPSVEARRVAVVQLQPPEARP